MDHLYLILTPILMLGVLALARFVGCDLVFKISDPPPRFVTSTALLTVRNDFTGWVGMVIRVGPDPIEVRHLGRTMVIATTQPHVVKIVEPAGDGGVDLGFVTIPPSAPTESGFAYAGLPTPVTLTPEQEYYVVSHEVSGGDSWHDKDTMVSTTAVAQVTSAVFNDDAVPRYVREASLGNTFGPVDFTYVEPE